LEAEIQRKRNQSQENAKSRMYRNGNKNVGVPRRNEHLKLKDRQEKNMIKDNMEKVINDNSQAIKIKRKYDNLEKKKE
jgi:hypothetical protein